MRKYDCRKQYLRGDSKIKIVFSESSVTSSPLGFTYSVVISTFHMRIRNVINHFIDIASAQHLTYTMICYDHFSDK